MILVTGAHGFLGRAVCLGLASRYEIYGSIRGGNLESGNPKVKLVKASLAPDQNWTQALRGISVVIHCAARVHVMNEILTDPLNEFRKINVHGTLNLAKQAVDAGVKRFIFISSIKVNGDGCNLGRPFHPDQAPNPLDHYAISKYEAEIGLMELAKKSGMEVVVIRPPLIYGPGVKGNFLNLMRWLHKVKICPLGGVRGNLRSFIYIGNAVDFIEKCIDHPGAGNQTFLISDNKDISTAELVEKILLNLGGSKKLISIHPAILIYLANLFGLEKITERLFGSLQSNINKSTRLIQWSPPVSIDEGMRQTVKYFLEHQS